MNKADFKEHSVWTGILGLYGECREEKQNITCTYRKPINHLMHLSRLRVLRFWQRARDEILTKWNGAAIINFKENGCTRKKCIKLYSYYYSAVNNIYMSKSM